MPAKHRAKLPFPDELSFHREHTWIRREQAHLYRVGLDEIFLRDFASVVHLDLPNEGDEISQDEVCGVVRGRTLKKLLYAPLSGEVVDVNVELHEDLEILMEDPYGIGWIMLIDPSDPEEEMENLLQGEEAARWWGGETRRRRSGLSSPPAE